MCMRMCSFFQMYYFIICSCVCVCSLYGPFQGNSHFFKYTKSSLFHLLLIFSIVISVFLFFHGFLLLLLLLQYYSYCCSFVYLWNTPFKVCAQCVIYRIFYIRRDTFSSSFSLSLTTSTFFHTFDFLKGFFTLKFFCMPHLDFCIGLFLPRVGLNTSCLLHEIQVPIVIIIIFRKQMCALD